MNGKWGWQRLLDKYRFDALLVPSSWALTSALKLDPGWKLVYDDGAALFFERTPRPENPGADSETLAASNVLGVAKN